MAWYDDFRKPVHAVSVGLAIIFGLLFLYQWWSGTKAPEISYRIDTIKIFDKDASADSVSVLDRAGKLLTNNVYVSEIRVWNSGNAKADEGDIRAPLTIVLSDPATFVETKITGATNPTIEPFSLQQIDLHQLHLTWVHLDPQFGAKLRLISTSNEAPKFLVSGLIYGAGLREVSSEKQPVSWALALVGVLLLPVAWMLGNAATATLGAWLAKAGLERRHPYLFGAGLLAGATGFLLCLAVYLLYLGLIRNSTIPPL